MSKRLLQEDGPEPERRFLSYVRQNIGFAVLIAILIAVVPFVAIVDPEGVGRLASVFVACYLFRRQLLEFDDGSFIQRASRVLVVGIAFFGMSRLANTLLEMTPFEDNAVAICLSAFTAFLVTFALLLASCKLLKLNRIYTRPVPSSV